MRTCSTLNDDVVIVIRMPQMMVLREYLYERKGMVHYLDFDGEEQSIRRTELADGSQEDWNKKLEKSSNWVKIIFENRKVSIPREIISNAINSGRSAENLDKIQELGIVIACDIIQRHQGNIYTKKSKSSGFSLHICVPKID